MRRVVVTGIGIVSSIGNDKEQVRESLREGRSGIEFSQEYKDLGFRSHVLGSIKLDPDQAIDRRLRRFMGDGAVYNYVAMSEAIAVPCALGAGAPSAKPDCSIGPVSAGCGAIPPSISPIAPPFTAAVTGARAVRIAAGSGGA